MEPILFLEKLNTSNFWNMPPVKIWFMENINKVLSRSIDYDNIPQYYLSFNYHQYTFYMKSTIQKQMKYLD